MSIIVNPDEIHDCGSSIRESAKQWQEAVGALRPKASDSSCYGGDGLGAPLNRMHESCVGRSLDYMDRTGECVSETGFVVHEMARAYAVTEQDNLARATQITALLGSLGIA